MSSLQPIGLLRPPDTSISDDSYVACLERDVRALLMEYDVNDTDVAGVFTRVRLSSIRWEAAHGKVKALQGMREFFHKMRDNSVFTCVTEKREEFYKELDTMLEKRESAARMNEETKHLLEETEKKHQLTAK